MNKKQSDLHAEALKRFDICVETSQDERERALEDRRFYSLPGAMWEGAYGDQFANRPMLEINKMHLSIIRIFNEYRNNRITASFIAKNGDEDDDFADVCAGLYRADQTDSVAEEAFDNAFEESVGGGMGAWRLRAEYEDEYDEDDDRQRIRFEPITDADTCVFFDPNSKRQDKSDAKYCFVLNAMTKEAYKAEYNDDPESWPKTLVQTEFDWVATDDVYVAEYYLCEETTEEIGSYQRVTGEIEKKPTADVTDEMRREMEAVGTRLVSTRKVRRKAVIKYVLSGGGILEDGHRIAGTEIPIVPTYGKRWFIDGKERFCGHVRHSKDAQRLYNMQVSALAEDAAKGGERTPIVAPEQVRGHETAWAKRSISNPAYLLLNPVTNPDGSQTPSGPVGYTESAEVPQAMAALLEISNRDIADLLGNQQGGEEIESNISGKAVELIQSRLDMQTFIYVSNMAKAHRRCAQIWLSMAGDVYDEDDRRMKVVDEQDTTDFVEMGEMVLDKEGVPRKKYDLKRGKFDVEVDIGPTSGTKRQATVRSLTEMLGVVVDPGDQKVISATILRNMDGEGLSPIREHYRKQLVQMGVEDPTDEDIEEAQNQPPAQPSSNDIYLQSEAEKNAAQTGKAIADTEKTKAETLETLAGIDRDDRKQAVETAKVIQLAVNGSGTAAP